MSRFQEHELVLAPPCVARDPSLRESLYLPDVTDRFFSTLAFVEPASATTFSVKLLLYKRTGHSEQQVRRAS